MHSFYRFFIIIFFTHPLHAAVLEHEIVNNTPLEMTVELEFVGPREIKKLTLTAGNTEKVHSEACLIKVTATDPDENTKESSIEPKCIKQKIMIDPKDVSWQLTIVAPEEQLKKGERV